jgi:hypothetical protein
VTDFVITPHQASPRVQQTASGFGGSRRHRGTVSEARLPTADAEPLAHPTNTAKGLPLDTEDAGGQRNWVSTLSLGNRHRDVSSSREKPNHGRRPAYRPQQVQGSARSRRPGEAPPGDANSAGNRRTIRQMPDSLRNLPTALRSDKQPDEFALHANNQITAGNPAYSNPSYSSDRWGRGASRGSGARQTNTLPCRLHAAGISISGLRCSTTYYRFCS